jgi:hypothetical protein
VTEAFDFHPDFEPTELDEDFEADFDNEPLPPARELKRIGKVMDRLIASRAFIVGGMGPVGSGKTIGFGIKIQHHAAKQKGVLNPGPADPQIALRADPRHLSEPRPQHDPELEQGGAAPHGPVRQFGAADPPVLDGAQARRASARPGPKAIDICQVETEFRAIGDQTVEDALRGLEATAALVNEADRTHPDILTFLAGRVGRLRRSRSGAGGRSADLARSQRLATTKTGPTRCWSKSSSAMT